MCPPLIAAIPVIMSGGAAAGAAATATGATAAAATAASTAAVTAAWGTVGTAATLTSAGLGMVSAHQGAKGQAEAAKASYENSATAKINQDRLLNLQQSQEQEKFASEKIARDIQAQQAASRVAATDTGGFLNNNAITQDIMRQGLEANTMASQNLERSDAQFGEQRSSTNTTYKSRINSVSTPSRTATGLQIASHAIGGASDYAKYKRG